MLQTGKADGPLMLLLQTPSSERQINSIDYLLHSGIDTNLSEMDHNVPLRYY